MSVETPIAASPPAPPKRTWVRRVTPLLFLTAGVAFGAAGMAGVNLATQPSAKPPPASEPEKENHTSVKFAQEKWASAGIKIESLTPTVLDDRAWRAGRIVLDEDRVARIAPPVEGVIIEMRVRLGEDVRAGAVLAVLESREIAQAKLEFVRARVAVTAERERAGWAQSTAKNTADLVKVVAEGKPAAEIDTEFKERPVGDRRQTLMTAYANRNQLRLLLVSQRASSGVVADATIRKTEADVEAAEASLRALCEEFRFQAAQQARQAELKVKEAEAAFLAARTHLLILGLRSEVIEIMDPAAEGAAAARFEIKAPFAGTIVEKHGVRSARVTPQVQMFQLADLSTVWVQADTFEADSPMVRGLGSRPIVFRAPAAGVDERNANVLYSGDLVDRTSRALVLTGIAKNPDRVLKPGMYVEVGLPRGEPRSALQVPQGAIVRHGGKTFVFVHVKDDEFRRVDVELVREDADPAEVKSGLAPGDAVVIKGAFPLKSEMFRDELVGE